MYSYSFATDTYSFSYMGRELGSLCPSNVIKPEYYSMDVATNDIYSIVIQEMHDYMTTITRLKHFFDPILKANKSHLEEVLKGQARTEKVQALNQEPKVKLTEKDALAAVYASQRMITVKRFKHCMAGEDYTGLLMDYIFELQQFVTELDSIVDLLKDLYKNAATFNGDFRSLNSNSKVKPTV